MDPAIEKRYGLAEPGTEPVTVTVRSGASDSTYGKYRKAIVAAFGVLLIAVGLYSGDQVWSWDDTRTILEAIGAALGVYEVPNDSSV